MTQAREFKRLLLSLRAVRQPRRHPCGGCGRQVYGVVYCPDCLRAVGEEIWHHYLRAVEDRRLDVKYSCERRDYPFGSYPLPPGWQVNDEKIVCEHGR